jgi:23S rRNA (uracil1939-C5)-methyltransferase
LVEGLKNSFPNLKTFLHTYCSRRADVVDPEEVRIIYGEGYFEEILGKYIFRISPFSFFQPNPFQALNLYQLVKEWVGEGNNLVIDLYSGSGGISVFVAPGNKEVLGVELLEEAVKDAYLNLRLNKITNCRFITGNVKEVLRSLLPRLSSFPVTMIVDPPRAGVPKKVIYQILSLAPEKIIYLSCNLKTLASCLQNFLKFYKIFSLRSVDMFPQTPHQEVVLLLERKSKS